MKPLKNYKPNLFLPTASDNKNVSTKNQAKYMSESEKPKKSIKSQRKIERATKKHTQKLLFVQISTKTTHLTNIKGAKIITITNHQPPNKTQNFTYSLHNQ